MDGMDDYEHSTQPSLPAMVVARPVMRVRRAEQRLMRWHSGRLPDRLRRVSRHPAVVSSLATAAGLLVHAGLRWALTPQGRSVQLAGSAITPTSSSDGGSLVLFSRTVVVETWTVLGRRI
jgi:hypothetical protein